MRNAEITAAVVIAGAFVGAALSSTPIDEARRPMPAIATVDAPIAAGEVATLSVNVYLGSRPTGFVEYEGAQFATVSIGYQDTAGSTLRTGEAVRGYTTLLVTVKNTTAEPQRIAGLVHYTPPVK